MQQVADWLEKLGLGQYARRFAENDIDFALFTKLTDADLKELGVMSLGHRKRLLEAIRSPPPKRIWRTLPTPRSATSLFCIVEAPGDDAGRGAAGQMLAQVLAAGCSTGHSSQRR
jgi:SAM domain (Sterile alpha motif)